MREDAKHGTHIQGAVELAVGSAAEIMEHMQRGSVYRTTEATNCNEVSSRSHAVLQVTVQAVQKYGEEGGQTRRLSKLSLIDLAGSERAVSGRRDPSQRGQKRCPRASSSAPAPLMLACRWSMTTMTRAGNPRVAAPRASLSRPHP